MTLIVTLATLIWAVTGGLAWFLGGVITGLPTGEELRDVGTMARATTIYDVHDQPAFTIFKEQRIEVPLGNVSPAMIGAIVAVEDQRFFEHGGVDVIRVAGAAWKNVREGWGTQGGSTITQQLARQSFLTPDKTVRRKLKEIVVAARLEDEFAKDQILEMYLNKVYFGDGLYGVEAASLGYFGKHASELGVAEAALLAGLVKAPSTQAPTEHMERAVSRRNAVLQAMRDAGAIDLPTYERAVRSEVVLKDGLRGEETFGQYFKEEVRKQLVQQFGWERVYHGGLRVYTTLDLDMQKLAEAEVRTSIEEIEKRQSARLKSRDGNPLQAALVSMDPRTGEVRAMVGGRSFDSSRFNRVTQARRQAGSAFKPFIYAAALERGYSPASILDALDTPVMTLQGAWVPEDHGDSPSMSIRAAMRTSSNRAAVRMLQAIGIPAAVGHAQRLGVGTVPSVPSLALGSGEVTLMSMTAAYSAFANKGMLPSPVLIRRVEGPDGDVLAVTTPHLQRAVSEATAFLMTTMMADVVNAGTAWQARRVGFTLPAAGKTGTTNDYRDAWFVGYTPSLVTGVWLGYDQPRTIIGRGYAGTLAVPLWGRFMAAATRGAKAEPFKAPRTVTTATICRLSGKLAGDSCRRVETMDGEGFGMTTSMVYTEYFVRGTEPVEYCNGHVHPFAVPALAATPGVPGPVTSPARDPVPVATTGIAAAVPAAAPPPAVAQVPAAVNVPAPTAAQRERARGFWGRVFRRGNGTPAPAPPRDAPAPSEPRTR